MSDTVKIRKKNRILRIEKDRLPGFLKQGYDQIDESGKIIKRATGGRMISVAEYNEVIEELEKIKKSPNSTKEFEKEIEDLKSEIKKLKTENTRLKKALDGNEGKEGN
ncbi:hypothetical protein GCM10011391_28070 [Pullulanibacillus camelliae]|uniref:Uncharacterized protein n=1 Tax=Pullulanibacillus camelliae TaxID=1707096 RepID=A0A8J2YJA1_9BACL|nr:hypothetical protein [Pullulanibacillus camelliae]GGE47678.1 hypothetical protein GCM10011391_28070 [Pullulanibacillus camelliae]